MNLSQRDVRAILCHLLPLVLLWAASMVSTSGHFTYTLDDPYIHLAYAKQIALGTWQLSPWEGSVPSSSIVWPFLLVPWAGWAAYEWVPLGLNVLCLMGSIGVVRALLADQPGLVRESGTVVVLACCNAYGAVLSGMEHSLQILLALLAAQGFVLLQQGRLASADLRWLCAVLLLGPLVRYESLALSAPLLAVLFLAGHRRASVFTALALALALGAASALFHHLAGTVLPTSVMAKATDGSLAALADNVSANLSVCGVLLLLSLTLPYAVRPSFARWRWAVWVPLVLFVAVSGNASALRYSAFVVAYASVLLVGMWVRCRPRLWRVIYLLLVAQGFHVLGLLATPLASANIYAQQAQMARLVRYLDEPVAINDLGLVALRGGVPVLDLYGLASPQAMRLRRDPQADPRLWMSALMAERGVRIALVYEHWFPVRPTSWTKVADLRMTLPNVVAGSASVALYAVDPAAAQRLTRALHWLLVHPQGAAVSVCWPSQPVCELPRAAP